MEVRVLRRELLSAVDVAARVMPATTPLPELKHVLLHANGNGQLTVSGSDTHRFVEVAVPAEIRSPGEVCVPGDQFRRILSGFSEGEVSLKLDLDNLSLSFRCAGSGYKLPGLGTDGFPSLSGLPSIVREVSVPQRWLRRAIQAVLPAVNKSQENEQLRGVNVRLGAGQVVLAATDTHRLHMATLDAGGGEPVVAVTIPWNALDELAKSLTETDEPLRLTLGERQVEFRAERFLLSSGVFDKPFPRYERVFPPRETVNHAGVVSLQDILSAVRRARVVADTDLIHTNRVVFNWSPTELRLQARGEGSTADEPVSCEFTGETPFYIGINANYALDALRVMETERVRIEHSVEVVKSRDRGDYERRSFLVHPVGEPEPVRVYTQVVEMTTSDWEPL